MAGNDAKDIGQGRTYNDAMDKAAAQEGTYKDAIPNTPVDSRIGTAAMPQGTDPSPFTLGPMGSGGSR